MRRLALYFAYTALALFLLALPLLILDDYFQARSLSAETTGTVVETGSSYKGQAGCTITFPVEKKDFMVETVCGSSQVVGDSVQVRYDPTDARYVSLSSPRQDLVGTLIGLTAWLFMLGVTAGSYLRQKGKLSLKKVRDPKA